MEIMGACIQPFYLTNYPYITKNKHKNTFLIILDFQVAYHSK